MFVIIDRRFYLFIYLAIMRTKTFLNFGLTFLKYFEKRIVETHLHVCRWFIIKNLRLLFKTSIFVQK